MNALKLSAVVFFFILLSGVANQLQAQPEFATVRLVTTWRSKGSVLFVSKGKQEMETIELRQMYSDTKLADVYDFDNKTINSLFEVLYSEGYKLVSSTSADVPQRNLDAPGREIIFLLVKE